MEEYAYIIDYLPQGRAEDKKFPQISTHTGNRWKRIQTVRNSSIYKTLSISNILSKTLSSTVTLYEFNIATSSSDVEDSLKNPSAQQI